MRGIALRRKSRDKKSATGESSAKGRFAWQIPLAVTLLLFGLIITMQYNTQVQSNDLENQPLSNLAALVINLSEKRDSLRAELEFLQGDLLLMEEKVKSGLSVVETLESQHLQMLLINGVLPIEGPGVTVKITGESALLYYDLIDLVNELFASGAEVVAINDIRIQVNTEISERIHPDGSALITINGQELLSPIIIKAIGKSDTLEKGLTFPGGIIDNLNILYQVYPTVKKEDLVQIPATMPVSYNHARRVQVEEN